MKQLLKSLMAKAARLGLSQEHLNLARDFLDGHEFGLCLDTIVTLVFGVPFFLSMEKRHFCSILLVSDKRNY